MPCGIAYRDTIRFAINFNVNKAIASVFFPSDEEYTSFCMVKDNIRSIRLFCIVLIQSPVALKKITRIYSVFLYSIYTDCPVIIGNYRISDLHFRFAKMIVYYKILFFTSRPGNIPDFSLPSINRHLIDLNRAEIAFQGENTGSHSN